VSLLFKRETRILGLSGARTKEKVVVVGVVFRGSLWLDGVSTSTIDLTERNFNSAIARMIGSTKQFSQLHAVILSRRLTAIMMVSIVKLSGMVGLPVIQPSKQVKKQGPRGLASVAKSLDLVVNRKHNVVSAVGIDREKAEQLYRVACNPSSTMPEAVRVADLIAQELRHRPLNSQRNEPKRTDRTVRSS